MSIPGTSSQGACCGTAAAYGVAAPTMAESAAAGMGRPVQANAVMTNSPQFHQVIANTEASTGSEEVAVGSGYRMSEPALTACLELNVLRRNGQITDEQYRGMVQDIRQNDAQQQFGGPAAQRQPSGFVTSSAEGPSTTAYGDGMATTEAGTVGESYIMSEGAQAGCRQAYLLHSNGKITDEQYQGILENIRQNDAQQQFGGPPAQIQLSGTTASEAGRAGRATPSRPLPSLEGSKLTLTAYYANHKPDSGKDFTFKSLEDLANSTPGPDGPTQLEVDAAKRFMASPNTMHALDGGNGDQVFSQKNLEQLTIDPAEDAKHPFINSNGATVINATGFSEGAGMPVGTA
jgi:hypothetical protein